MRSRQGLGPRFQALASATGWMRAMTPSPMRTMAAKCFARVGFVMSIMGWRVFFGRSVVRECAVGEGNCKGQRQKQIPRGKDRKKGKGKGKYRLRVKLRV